MPLSRRTLLTTGVTVPWLSRPGFGAIQRIEHKGVLIREPAVEGERRIDNTVPAHPNGIQVSRDRWLLVYATRKFRGTDDDTSILWQLRRSAPDGGILKEGIFARSVDDWNPTGDGKRRFVKQHGHPVAFGVPKGAVIRGRPAANANVFACKFRRVALEIDPETNVVQGTNLDPKLIAQTLIVQWVQFRLNEREDDLEILQPLAQMRQMGYESGKAAFRHEQASHYAQEKTAPVPYNADCTEWLDLVSCNLGHAAVKTSFNARTGLYEWTETGPILHPAKRVSDTSIAPYRDSWVVASRTDSVRNHQKHGPRGLEWIRVDDPLKRTAESVHSLEPPCASPVGLYVCPDGVLRMTVGTGPMSPHRNERDPLYLWEIDPDRGFKGSNPLVVFDTVKARLPIRRMAMAKVDMGKLLAHSGGTVQYLMHRVSVQSINYDHFHPKEGFWDENPVPWTFPAISQKEKSACAIYYAKIHYAEPHPPTWTFGQGR